MSFPAKQDKSDYTFICRISAFAILCFEVITPYSCLAQVSNPITSTVGAGNLGTAVTQVGNTFQITGGSRPGNSSNLFHSFGEFGVPANNIANFLNDSGLATSNILGRVTGGSPSNIFGTIQTTGFGAANLFLMNPAGIVFGPNASLNVGGSVSFTTADYLRLADGGKFTAIPGSLDTSISSAPVAAFGFLGSNPGAITVQGSQLSVANGQSIALVSGDVTIGAAAPGADNVQPAMLSAPGGKIYLASTKSPGEFETQTLGQAPNVNGQSFSGLGMIQISQKSVIDASGDGGGTVVIRGGRFLLNDSTISANISGPTEAQPGAGIDIAVSQDAIIENGAILETNVTGSGTQGVQYGGITLKADRILVQGIPDFDTFPFTGFRSNVDADSSAGSSGNIILEANSISLKDLAAVDTSTRGTGNGGNITIRSLGDIDLINSVEILSSSGSFTTNGSTSVLGNAGNIDVTSMQGNIHLAEGSFITSQTQLSTGNTGKITTAAPQGNIVLDGALLFTSTVGTGGTGEVQFTSKNMELLHGSAVTLDNSSSVQPDGISLSVTDNLTMTGGSIIATASLSTRGAPAADLSIRAKNVLVTQDSLLTSSTFRSGRGGQLSVEADSLQITDGGQISSGSTSTPFGLRSVPTGPGGDITIQTQGGTPGLLLIEGPRSGIFTNAEGTGAGGNVNISSQSITIQNGGTISAATTGSAPSAVGGNIAISANQLVSLNNGGTITASSTGPANAGNVAINAGAQFLSNNSSITTQASQASGGNITIQATDSIRLVNSQLSTSVQGGPNTAGGNIILDPAVVTLQNSQVTAQAVQGQGGNINIIAGTFLSDPTSVVSASSQFGLSGSVNIQSPVSSLSNTLATLPQRPLQPQPLLSQRCAAQVNGQLSSLVVAGRDALPVEPGGWQMSPLAFMADATPTEQAHVTTTLVSGVLHQRSVEQHVPSSQRGVWDRETGCGS